MTIFLVQTHFMKRGNKWAKCNFTKISN